MSIACFWIALAQLSPVGHVILDSLFLHIHSYMFVYVYLCTEYFHMLFNAFLWLMKYLLRRDENDDMTFKFCVKKFSSLNNKRRTHKKFYVHHSKNGLQSSPLSCVGGIASQARQFEQKGFPELETFMLTEVYKCPLLRQQWTYLV